MVTPYTALASIEHGNEITSGINEWHIWNLHKKLGSLD